MALPLALGKTISNEVFMVDMAKMPHLLVAGATDHACAGLLAEKEIGAHSVMCDDILTLMPRVIQNILNKRPLM